MLIVRELQKFNGKSSPTYKMCYHEMKSSIDRNALSMVAGEGMDIIAIQFLFAPRFASPVYEEFDNQFEFASGNSRGLENFPGKINLFHH